MKALKLCILRLRDYSYYILKLLFQLDKLENNYVGKLENSSVLAKTLPVSAVHMPRLLSVAALELRV